MLMLPSIYVLKKFGKYVTYYPVDENYGLVAELKDIKVWDFQFYPQRFGEETKDHWHKLSDDEVNELSLYFRIDEE